MSWNNALERKKFEAEWKRREAEFRAAGLSEEQIQHFREFEEETFRSDRRYYMHTQPLQVCEFDEDDCDESDNALFNNNLETLSVEMEPLGTNSRYGWIEEFENEELASRLYKLSDDDLLIVTLLFVENRSKTEIARIQGVSQQAISKKWARIKKILVQGL